MDFKEFLNEAGKNPVKIKWDKMIDSWTGIFTINKIQYNISASIVEKCNNDNVWEFKFYKNENITKITGDFKTHFQMVPTISNALDEFVKQVKPEILVFLASDESKSRKKLYKSHSDYIATKYNYIAINPMFPKNDILFGICKTEKQLKCLKDMIE